MIAVVVVSLAAVAATTLFAVAVIIHARKVTS